jgi:hypothetical protein
LSEEVRLLPLLGVSVFALGIITGGGRREENKEEGGGKDDAKEL